MINIRTDSDLETGKMPVLFPAWETRGGDSGRLFVVSNKIEGKDSIHYPGMDSYQSHISPYWAWSFTVDLTSMPYYKGTGSIYSDSDDLTSYYAFRALPYKSLSTICKNPNRWSSYLNQIITVTKSSEQYYWKKIEWDDEALCISIDIYKAMTLMGLSTNDILMIQYSMIATYFGTSSKIFSLNDLFGFLEAGGVSYSGSGTGFNNIIIPSYGGGTNILDKRTGIRQPNFSLLYVNNKTIHEAEKTSTLKSYYTDLIPVFCVNGSTLSYAPTHCMFIIQFSKYINEV